MDGTVHSVVVVGAGISGLALTYWLERRGIGAMVLDCAPRVGESWRKRHKQLRLNTHRTLSRLPGMRMSSKVGAFAARDDVVRFLERYESNLRSAVQFGVRALRIDRDGEIWRVKTSSGTLLACNIVIATGRERVPVVPAWPGLDSFTGEMRHAAEFGDAQRYRRRSVLVVGVGNSGVDVLNHLAGISTRQVWAAARNGATVIPGRLWGMPTQRLSPAMELLPAAAADRILAVTEHLAFGDLRRLGLPRSDLGAATRLAQDGVAPAIDDGFVAALKNGRIRIISGVAKFAESEVILTDSERLRPDTVICATGYSPGLEDLVGHLRALDEKGFPRFHGAEADAGLPGLWFMGMRPRLSGNFQSALTDSRRLSKKIVRRLGRRGPLAGLT